MSVNSSPLGGFATQFFDNNGVILSGGKIYTYAAGTTTPQATYTSLSGVTAHANPIILDSAGRVPGGEIWLTDSLLYKFVIETSTGILIGSYDNILGINASFSGTLILNIATLKTAIWPLGRPEVVQLINNYNAGDGGGSFRWDSASTATDNGGTIIKETATTTGRWLRQFDGAINARWFGATGNGVTDDTAALQAAINTGVYTSKTSIFIPAGSYSISDTLQAGYGTSFTSAYIFGDGPMYYGASQFAGTCLVMTKADRPAINFQGQREGTLENIAILGLMFPYLQASSNFTDLNPTINVLDPANWVDPALLAANPNMDSRYAPYAAVTVDAYSGAQPSPAYPAVTYPAFLGSGIAQYNKSTSSVVTFRKVSMFGFVAGAVIHPGDSDGNGDFVRFENVLIAYNKYGISVGQTQSRQVEIQNALIDVHYVALTNITHGRQNGVFGSPIINSHFTFNIKMFSFNAFAKSVTFINCYGEAAYQLGDFAASTSNEVAMTFIGCEFAFDRQAQSSWASSLCGVPAFVLAGGSQPQVSKFIACRFGAYPNVLTFQNVQPVFENCSTRSVNGISDASNTPRQYIAFAKNATADGIILVTDSNIFDHTFHFLNYNVDTLAGEVAAYRGTPSTQARDRLLSIYAREAAPQNDTNSIWGGKKVQLPPRRSTIAKSGFSSCTLTNRTLTFTFSSYSDDNFAYSGPDVGDVLVDPTTGSTFFVRNRSSLTVTAELQNNYKVSGAGFVTLTPFSTTVGNLNVLNSRFYVVPYYLRGDSTSGSAVLTNCARDDGFAAWYNAEIAVNDWLFVNTVINNWVPIADTKVTARDQGAGTITLAGNASRSQTREPLQLFIRQAATGVP
jgi:hypothetical protein